MEMDFGELKNDKNFVENITQLSACLKEIDQQVANCVEFPNYDKLTTEQKVKFDLYLSYTMNSLYWMHVKLQGIDPNTHGIKNEISRVRQAMLREKQIQDKALRPLVDKKAAGRFIKHGIHYREDRNQDEGQNEIEKNSVRGKFVKIKTQTQTMVAEPEVIENKTGSNIMDNSNAAYTISDESADDKYKSPPKKKKTIEQNDKIINISDDDDESAEKSIRKRKKKRK